VTFLVRFDLEFLDVFLAEGSPDSSQNSAITGISICKHLLDFLGVRHGADGGMFKILTGNTLIIDHDEESVLKADALVFLAVHVGDIHVVGGGTDILELFASEDIDANQVDLGVAVFAGF